MGVFSGYYQDQDGRHVHLEDKPDGGFGGYFMGLGKHAQWFPIIETRSAPWQDGGGYQIYFTLSMQPKQDPEVSAFTDSFVGWATLENGKISGMTLLYGGVFKNQVYNGVLVMHFSPAPNPGGQVTPSIPDVRGAEVLNGIYALNHLMDKTSLTLRVEKDRLFGRLIDPFGERNFMGGMRRVDSEKGAPGYFFFLCHVDGSGPIVTINAMTGRARGNLINGLHVVYTSSDYNPARTNNKPRLLLPTAMFHKEN